MVVLLETCEAAAERRHKILEIARECALLRGKFTLSSGKERHYYWDGKRATTSPMGAWLIGEEIYELIKDSNVQAVGGVGTGGGLMAAAVALVSYVRGKSIPAFVIRVNRKQHGNRKSMEGQFPEEKGARVAIVHDTITTGDSICQAIRLVESEDCKVAKVVVMLDQHEGGSEKLRRLGYDFNAIIHSRNQGEISINEPSGRIEQFRKEVRQGLYADNLQRLASMCENLAIDDPYPLPFFVIRHVLLEMVGNADMRLLPADEANSLRSKLAKPLEALLQAMEAGSSKEEIFDLLNFLVLASSVAFAWTPAKY